MPISSIEFTAVDGTMTNCAWAAKVKCTWVRSMGGRQFHILGSLVK